MLAFNSKAYWASDCEAVKVRVQARGIGALRFLWQAPVAEPVESPPVAEAKGEVRDAASFDRRYDFQGWFDRIQRIDDDLLFISII